MYIYHATLVLFTFLQANDWLQGVQARGDGEGGGGGSREARHDDDDEDFLVQYGGDRGARGEGNVSQGIEVTFSIKTRT